MVSQQSIPYWYSIHLRTLARQSLIMLQFHFAWTGHGTVFSTKACDQGVLLPQHTDKKEFQNQDPAWEWFCLETSLTCSTSKKAAKPILSNIMLILFCRYSCITWQLLGSETRLHQSCIFKILLLVLGCYFLTL